MFRYQASIEAQPTGSSDCQKAMPGLHTQLTTLVKIKPMIAQAGFLKLKKCLELLNTMEPGIHFFRCKAKAPHI